MKPERRVPVRQVILFDFSRTSFSMDSSKFIKLPIFGGIMGDHGGCKCMVILRDFPYNSALFGLVILVTPVL